MFVDETDEVPQGAVAVFSAHCVAARVHQTVAVRDLEVIDATCPADHPRHHTKTTTHQNDSVSNRAHSNHYGKLRRITEVNAPSLPVEVCAVLGVNGFHRVQTSRQECDLRIARRSSFKV